MGKTNKRGQYDRDPDITNSFRDRKNIRRDERHETRQNLKDIEWEMNKLLKGQVDNAVEQADRDFKELGDHRAE